MKRILYFGTLLLVVSTEPRISLDDIEADNLRNEAHLNEDETPKAPVQSPTKFGFQPVKTIQNYAKPPQSYQQNNFGYVHPERQYLPQVPTTVDQQDYVYITPRVQPKYQPQNQPSYQPESQPKYQQETQPQIQQHNQPQYQPLQQYEYVHQPQQQQVQQYLPPKPGQQRFYSVQQDLHQKYYAAQQQGPSAYQQYDNVQFVTDNHIGQQQPGFVYLQQYQAPSNNVQNYVDPKTVQYYVMVPTYAKTTTQSVEQPQEQYQTEEVEQQSDYEDSQEAYVPQQASNTYQHPPVELMPNYDNFRKPVHEPKSLLESYVPSILQYKAFKEQEAQNNKLGGSTNYFGKVSYVKTSFSTAPNSNTTSERRSLISYAKPTTSPKST